MVPYPAGGLFKTMTGVDMTHVPYKGAAPDVREKMLNLGAEPVGSKPEEFAACIRGEAQKYACLVKASGAKAD